VTHGGELDARNARLSVACRALITERALLVRHLGKEAFPNPRWDVVLDLFLANLEGKQFYQSWLAPQDPPANAHRHSARLEELGIIRRIPDLTDHRRMIVELKPNVMNAMEEITDALTTCWQKVP
jgi:hypothetical protein